MTDTVGSLDRRSLLSSAVAAGVAATSGCLEQLRSTVAHEPLDQVSLTIKTVPADTDEAAVRIARELAKNLDRVGIDAEVLPLAEEKLLRDVLVNGNYDLYVARYPGQRDADFLRTALHSTYVEEPGWQNPFGYADITVDESLDEQRRAPPVAREKALESLREAFVRDSPFSVVAFPDEPRAMRTDRFTGWFDARVHSKLGYLSLKRLDTPADGDTTDSQDVLRVATTDGRPTRNRNPLSVEFRDRGVVTNLLYDSLGHRIDGWIEPWLAASWSWGDDGDRPTLDIDLRDGLTFHDGVALTPEDVAFTYRFLADTSLGEGSMSVPSPRYRGRASLVDAVEVLDEQSVRLQFVPASKRVAARSLDVPILPEHVWRDRAVPANIGGVPLSDYATEALVSNNPQAIGSGPFRFQRAVTDERLELRRFDEHFLSDEPLGGTLTTYAGGPAFETLQFDVVPSPGAALELLVDDAIDLTAAPIDPGDVPKVGQSPALRLSVDTMESFYHVGFNARRKPLGNPRFRHVLARLLDREHVTDTVFGGYASAETNPLARTEQSILRSEENRNDHLAFPGSDGNIDAEQGKKLFREAGYSYRDGMLLAH